jgi:hypothetical protein
MIAVVEGIVTSIAADGIWFRGPMEACDEAEDVAAAITYHFKKRIALD